MTASSEPRRPDRDREAQRQRLLVQALWRQAPASALVGWLAGDAQRQAQGLAAYRGNAAAVAERALGAAYPTVRLLLGEDSFVQLARALWHAHPPTAGDLARWGDALPAYVAADAQLADEPYLADVARLDWAVHRAESAPEVTPATSGAAQAPAGAALVVSPWPVVSIWHAHHRAEAIEGDPFAPVRALRAAGRGECALVWRDPQGIAQVMALDEADTCAMQSLLART